ncbi:MAG: hypothetical protein R3B45_08810 [Bdellovibrionota bacterium]
MDTAQLKARLRLDRQLVLEFFSSIASVLNAKGYLSLQDIDSLRVTIADIQSQRLDDFESIQSQLFRKNENFCQLLTSIYGEEKLYQNILRYTAKSLFIELRATLGAFGNSLIDKSKLFLNRTTIVYQDKKAQEKRLLSSLLIDAAEIVQVCTDSFSKIIIDFDKMLPISIGVEQRAGCTLDQDLYQALGFGAIDSNSLASTSEHLARLATEFVVQTFTTSTFGLIEKLADNKSDEGYLKLKMLEEDLQFETKKLNHSLNVSYYNEPEQWELFRQNFITCLLHMNNRIKKLGMLAVDFVNKKGLENNSDKVIYTEEMKRGIIFELISKGLQCREAKEAAHCLTDYLNHHNLEPDKVITSELENIHQSLSHESLTTLQSLYKKHDLSTVGMTREKNHALKKAGELQKVFKKHIGTSASLIIALLFFIIAGCGVKTAPLSKELDFQPEIPFRSNIFNLQSANPGSKINSYIKMRSYDKLVKIQNKETKH